jgi:hypothetical protein
VKGQIYLGVRVLERMQELADGRSVREWPKRKRGQNSKLMKSSTRWRGSTVFQYRKCSTGAMQKRIGWRLYDAPGRNLSLQVAKRAGVSIARISQIQTKIEAENISKQMAELLKIL